jgi:hypothetical protein
MFDPGDVLNLFRSCSCIAVAKCGRANAMGQSPDP